MIGLFFRLASHPPKVENLHAELADVDCPNDMVLQSLPYLNGVLNEALRLHPALPTKVTGRRQKRVPLHVGDSFPGTPLSLHQDIRYSEVDNSLLRRFQSFSRFEQARIVLRKQIRSSLKDGTKLRTW